MLLHLLALISPCHWTLLMVVTEGSCSDSLLMDIQLWASTGLPWLAAALPCAALAQCSQGGSGDGASTPSSAAAHPQV